MTTQIGIDGLRVLTVHPLTTSILDESFSATGSCEERTSSVVYATNIITGCYLICERLLLSEAQLTFSFHYCMAARTSPTSGKRSCTPLVLMKSLSGHLPRLVDTYIHPPSSLLGFLSSLLFIAFLSYNPSLKPLALSSYLLS